MKRLLVLRLSALGDVIHTIPAVAALREHAQIAWVVENAYRELVEIVADVTTVPVRMKAWGRAPLASRRDFTTAVRAMRGVDASIDFQGLMKSAIFGVLSGAKDRYGFDRDAIREKPALVFTNRRVRVDTSRHVIEQNLELARGVVRTLAPVAPRWASFPTPVDVRGDIVLLPGAGKPNKIWAPERFRELARRLGDRVLVVWGPGEHELAENIGARMAPPTNLRELAFLLQQAKVVVGGDTGPLHLAAALGTKVVGLYGPTDPRRNGPYGWLDHCVSTFTTAKSMDAIRVEEVMKSLEGLGEA